MNYNIPVRLQRPLVEWVQRAIKPSGFLQAVLRNDFREAVMRSDDFTTLLDLQQIQRFLHNACPPECYGSPDAVSRWGGVVDAKAALGKTWDFELESWGAAKP